MGSFSLWHWLIVIAIIMLLFYGRRRARPATTWGGLDANLGSFRAASAERPSHGMFEGAALPIILIALADVAMLLVAGHLMSPMLIRSLATGAAAGCLLAIAQACVVISGAVDLSLGGAMVLSGTVMVLASMSGISGSISLIAGLGAGVGCGIFNAVLLEWTRLPSFAVTLATGQIMIGIVFGMTGSTSFLRLETYDSEFNLLRLFGGGTTLGGPLLAMGAALGLGWLLSRSDWGRSVFSVGEDAEGARLAGVQVARVRLTVFALAGFIAALAAWVFVGRVGGIAPMMGTNSSLESLAAVVAGGVLIRGGVGSVVGAALGAVAMKILTTTFAIAGVEGFWATAVAPVILLTAAIWTRRSSEKAE
ncbi:hypothetical protein ACC702_33965 [Rhizobium ruizarguesonis]